MTSKFNMALEYLYRLIREKQTILFIGSGCSVGAGFPTGRGLAQMLYDDLTQEEQKQTNSNKSLAEIATDYELMRDNNALIKFIRRVFTDKKKDSEFNLLLAKIPFWSDIVCTNYDTLAESSIGESNCCVIRCDKDLSLAETEDKIRIFKIHGDVHTSELILTTSDYNTKAFEAYSEHEVVWNYLKAKFATKHIVFVGYSFSDGNIENVVFKLKEKLGKAMPQPYLIAPGLSELDRKRLQQKGIEYVDKTGEVFLSDLIDDSKQHVAFELKDANVKETRTFFEGFNVSPIIVSTSKSTIIKSVKPLSEEPLEYHAEFTVTKEANKLLASPVMEFEPAPRIIEGDMLKNFGLKVNGLSLLDRSRINKLIFQDKPNIDITVNLHFKNKGVLKDVRVRSFGSGENLSIILKTDFIEFFVTNVRSINGVTNFNIGYKYSETVKNVYKALGILKYIQRVCQGETFTLKNKQHGEYKNAHLMGGPTNDDIDFSDMIRYFEDILRIQRYYKVIFSDVEFLRRDFKQRVEDVIHFIDKTTKTQRIEGDFVVNENDTTRPFVEEEFNGECLIFHADEERKVSLFGKELRVGTKYHIIPNIKSSKHIVDGTGYIILHPIDNVSYDFYDESIPDLDTEQFELIKMNNSYKVKETNVQQLLQHIIEQRLYQTI